MSLLSDNEIKSLCDINTHKLSFTEHGKLTEILINKDNYKEKLDTIFKYYNRSFNGFEQSFEKLDLGYTELLLCNTNSFTEFQLTKLEKPTLPMISPFVSESVKYINDFKIPSFGSTSYGYDIRLGRNYKVFKCNDNNIGTPVSYFKDKVKYDTYIESINGEIEYIDPCNFDSNAYSEFNDIDALVIPGNGFVLAHSLEHFIMPNNVLGICMGKSTMARCAISLLVTPLEPGWQGYLTLEIKNMSEIPVLLTSGSGICQLNFFKSDQQCSVSYSDRGGKYQNQPAIPVDAK